MKVQIYEVDKIAKVEYSFWVGLWKSVKNNAIILGGAALLHLLNTAVDWVPPEYGWLITVIGGFAAYLVKNRVMFQG